MGADDSTNADMVAGTNANDLHAGDGATCPRCGRPIQPHQPVRRTVSGGYQHDSC